MPKERTDRVALYVASTVLALLFTFLLAVWPAGAQEAPGASPGKAPNLTLTGGKDDGAAKKAAEEAAKDAAEKEKAAAAAKAKAEAEKKAADEAAKLKPAGPAKVVPLPVKTTVKAACHHKAGKRAPKKARVVKILSVKESKDRQIQVLRDQLAKEKSHAAILHARERGRLDGIAAVKDLVVASRQPLNVNVNNSANGGAGGTATLSGLPGTVQAEPGKTSTSPQGGGDKPEIPDPKAPAKGTGKVAPSAGTVRQEGVPVRYLIPKGMGKLGG